MSLKYQPASEQLHVSVKQLSAAVLACDWTIHLKPEMLVCAQLYSLVTRPHKSWWSWAIHSLANGVYTFGFISMTPQVPVQS